MSVLEALARAKESRDLGPLTDAIPYARWMGISVDVSSGELLGKLTYSDRLVGNAALPALHGGTIGALLESTAVFQLMWEAEAQTLPKVVNITVSYLRSARAMDVHAHAVVTRHGRRVANVQATCWQLDRHRPVASANAHFLLKVPEAAPTAARS